MSDCDCGHNRTDHVAGEHECVRCSCIGVVAPSHDDPDAIVDRYIAALGRGGTRPMVSAADLAAQRTRADAAEAEVARLRREHAAVYRQAAHDRELRVAAEEALTTAREECDAARAEAVGLRARTTPPTDAEAAAHEAVGGTWIVGGRGEISPWLSASGVRYHRARAERHGVALWFLALSADNYPCPWPTVAAEAATGAALAGEGR